MSVLNFTFTFMPGKFTDVDTLWDGPVLVSKYLKKNKEINDFYFVIEKHPERPTRYHMHGQLDCTFTSIEKKFLFYTRISSYARKHFGINCLKWNDDNDRDGTYATYVDYCFKESNVFYKSGPTSSGLSEFTRSTSFSSPWSPRRQGNISYGGFTPMET